MEKDIGKIKKNDATDIIVRIDDFGGKPGLTIREFTTSEKYTGFTKSGTRIPADAFKDFRALINLIDEADLQKKPEAATSKEDTSKKPLGVVDTEKPAKKPAAKKKEKEQKIEDVPEEDLL